MALDTNNKETALSDNAEIYTPHKDIDEKEKWKAMSKEEKKTHFKDYYAVPLLVGLIVVAIAGYLIGDAILGYRNIVFMATIINDDMEAETLDEFNKDFLEYLGYDHKKDRSNVCDGFIVSGGSGADSVSATEAITSYIYAKQLDAMIADEDTFNHYASLGCFLDLTDILTEEQYEKYSDYIYYPEIKKIEGDNTNVPVPEKETIRPKETYPCGIYLGESDIYKELKGVQPNPVIGIVATSGHREEAVKFLEYLFQNLSK